MQREDSDKFILIPINEVNPDLVEMAKKTLTELNVPYEINDLHGEIIKRTIEELLFYSVHPKTINLSAEEFAILKESLINEYAETLELNRRTFESLMQYTDIKLG